MENWRKQEFDDGEYIYRGRFVEHPRFGYSSSHAHTSLVLKEEIVPEGIVIETLNSRYLLTVPKEAKCSTSTQELSSCSSLCS